MRDGNIAGILSRTTADGAAFYGYDGNGNVTLLTNSAGQDVGHYRYGAFGNTLEAEGPRAGENPYRFSTKELHAASGLYDFGLRFYSPGMGRWMNRDPLEEEGGVNLYAMVGNDPINNADPYGLDWLDDASNFSAGWGDMLTFGGTDWVRGKMGTNVVVKYNSGAYLGGQAVGAVHSIAMGSAGGLKATRAARSIRYARARRAARIRRSSSPAINRQKQAGHIPNTAQYKNRLKPNNQGKVKPTSSFSNKASADRLTQEAWRKGKSVNGNPKLKEYDFKETIGHFPNGTPQTKVRVSMDGKGRIHGTPYGW